MITKVYFEAPAYWYAELVAIFEGDGIPSPLIERELERLAKSHRMIVTTSVEEDQDINGKPEPMEPF